MNKLLRGLDAPTLTLFLIIVGFGIANIYSVHPESGIKQLMWLSIGILIGIMFFLVRVKFFENFSGIFYLLGIILLALLIPFGQVIHGAKAWFKFGSITLQPVEFVKLSTALFLGNLISSPGFNIKYNTSLFKAIFVISFPMALILMQPDFGSLLVFVAFFIALYREGLNGLIFVVGSFFGIFFLSSIYSPTIAVFILSIFLIILNSYYIFRTSHNYLLPILAVGGIIIFYYILFYHIFGDPNFFVLLIICVVLFALGLFNIIANEKNGLKNSLLFTALIIIISVTIWGSNYIFTKLPAHQQERVLVLYKGEKEYRNTAGYNLLYAKSAIAVGELFGTGYKEGTVTKGQFVPEQKTDYIFCTVGEEWGFVGSSILLLIYAIFISRIYFLSNYLKVTFSRVFGFSIASIFFIHFALNVGMVMGLFPTVGIPLPLFSYGGSSLLAFTLMVAIFLRLNYADKNSLF